VGPGVSGQVAALPTEPPRDIMDLPPAKAAPASPQAP
jgi:hypothetical protein